MIAGLSFASCYVYSPGGADGVSRRSRLLCTLLKTADPECLAHLVRRVRAEAALDALLAGFFAPGAVLVPVPGCRSRHPGHASRAERLARALLREGLGHALCGGLQRVCSVRKSATAAAGARPSVAAHRESFAFAADAVQPAAPRCIVLVDDVITKGRTLLAAAMCLHEVWPHTEIRAFAMLRTLGYAQGIDRVLEPCVGQIRWRAGDAWRTP